MKIRNGFVSNSSSSSFIISSKDKPKAIIEIDIEKMSSKIIRNKSELEKYLLEEHAYNHYKSIEGFLADDKYNREVYEQLMKELEKGNTIYCGSVSSDGDDGLENYVYYSGWGKNKNFDVIQGED